MAAHRARLLIAVSALVTVALAGVAVADRSGQHGKTVKAAARSTPTTVAQPQPGAEQTEAATSTTAGTTTTAVTRGTVAPATTSPPQPTTTAGNLQNDNVSILVVTETDDGKSYTLHRGSQGIEVQLSNGSVWTEPQTSDGHVLTKTSGSTNPDGSAQATFMASGDGQATVTAEGSSHPQPCQTAKPPCMMPDYVRQFHVNVTVVG